MPPRPMPKEIQNQVKGGIPAKRVMPAISNSFLMAWRERIASQQSNNYFGVNPFQVRDDMLHPPGVDTTGMAMDDTSNLNVQSTWAANAWAAGLAFNSAFLEGMAFPGYAYLSVLAQRPEYRRLSEIIATEMTRKWIKLESTGGDDDDKAEKIKQLNVELDRLKVRDVFRKCAEYDGFMGRAHLFIDTGDSDNPDELKTDIGNGRNAISKMKFRKKKGFLHKLKHVEAVWCYPTRYNANDPLSDDWYSPKTWNVMHKEIHKSRLLLFIGREVPDLLKPAYSFGGLSMSQMCKPYVDNWLRTRQAVADIIKSFSVFVLATNLSTILDPNGNSGAGSLMHRVDTFNLFRDNKGLMVLDKESEEFDNVAAPLSGLDTLQAATLEHICSVSGIPVVKYCGIQPNGMNASSEGEIRSFYDWIGAYQERLFRDPLTIIVDFTQLSLWGEVDQDITFGFEPLWSLDEKSLAEVRHTDATTDVELINVGVLSPEESRKRVAADPQSPHQSIDVEDVPDLLSEEEEGLEPHGTAAQIVKEQVQEGEGEASGGSPSKKNGEGEKEGNPRETPGHGTKSARRGENESQGRSGSHRSSGSSDRGQRGHRNEGEDTDPDSVGVPRRTRAFPFAGGRLDPDYLKKRIRDREGE